MGSKIQTHIRNGVLLGDEDSNITVPYLPVIIEQENIFKIVFACVHLAVVSPLDQRKNP